MTKLSTLLIAILLITVADSSIDAQRRRPKETAVHPAVTVGVGVFVGRVETVEAAQSGPVSLSVSKFDRRSGTVEGFIEFESGICRESSLTGLVDDDGMTLSGEIMCYSSARNFLTRCRFVGASNMDCSYSIKSTTSSQVLDKGRFRLSRFSGLRTAAASAKSSVVYEQRVVSVPAPPPVPIPKKYKVSFPQGNLSVDLAMVNSDQTSLLSSAYSGSSVSSLPPGTLLTIVNRDPVNGRIRVIDYNTGVEGWVPVDNVEVKYGSASQGEKLLDRAPGLAGRDPSVTVKNDSNKTLIFGLGDQSYTIGPYASRTIEVRPGRYRYYAAASKVLPLIGEDLLDAGYVYTWSFFVETKTQP